MKKTIAILLVAIMAVGSAFAAFSGSAQVGVGANFDTGEYGFIGNSTNVKFDVELATENVEVTKMALVQMEILSFLLTLLVMQNLASMV